mmetsp:Transcript_6645/g.25837  ORF Transcript_6645/g.25837 Transcript_6645/m.25837 type:complete len:212 (+) Transcript_6645:3-638(+)
MPVAIPVAMPPPARPAGPESSLQQSLGPGVVRVEVLARALVHEFHRQSNLDVARVPVAPNLNHLGAQLRVLWVKVLHGHHLGVVAVVPSERELVADVRAVHQPVADEAPHADEEAEGSNRRDASSLDRVQRRMDRTERRVTAPVGRLWRWDVGDDVREPALVASRAPPSLKGETHPGVAPGSGGRPGVPRIAAVPSVPGRRRWNLPRAAPR